AAWSPATCTARSPIGKPSTLRPAGRRSTRSDHPPLGGAPSAPSDPSPNRQPAAPAACRQALDALRPPSSRRRAKSAVVPVPDAVYQVKITLHGTKPPIWRRRRRPASTALAQLHQIIQVGFGWEDAHLHAFEVGGRRYSRPDFELWDGGACER